MRDNNLICSPFSAVVRQHCQHLNNTGVGNTGDSGNGGDAGRGLEEDWQRTESGLS